MKLSIKKYIDDTIRKEAEIGYDKSVKQWYGILEHKVGLIYLQKNTKAEIKKELAEAFEDFIILSLKEEKKGSYSEAKTHKIQTAYR